MNIFLILFVVVITLTLFYMMFSTSEIIKYNSNQHNNNQLPYLFQYWDTINGTKVPDYISLCMETVDRHCGKDFQVIRLNKNNIFDYLPELIPFKQKLESLIIAHQVDIYRILLLYKFGGIYLDADIIVMKRLTDLIQKLKKNDFIGFGCTGNKCKYGYGKPSNWILGAQKSSILMKNIFEDQISKLKQNIKFDYHDLGKNIIWVHLDNLIKNGYTYFHYPNTVDGTRDIDGNWIDSSIVFSNKKINYDDENNFMFYVFYNSGVDQKIKKMSKDEILSCDWNYTKFVKKSLGL